MTPIALSYSQCMTAVAILFVNTLPVIITDSLISSTGNITNNLHTPLTENEARIGIDGYRPAGIARKVWSISENVLFLYSGRVDHAERVFEKIGRDLSYGKIYDDSYHNMIAEMVAQDRLELSFIILSKEPDDEIGYYYHGNVYKASADTYGDVIAIGSGAEELVGCLHQRPSGALPDPSVSLRRFTEQVVVNSVHAAATLTIEYRNHASRLAAASTGAFFEVIFPTIFCPPEYKTIVDNFYGKGFAHVFMELDDTQTRIVKFVYARPEVNENLVITTREGTYASISNDGGINLSRPNLITLIIKEKRNDSEISEFDESIKSFNASHLIVYCRRLYRTCGHYYGTYSVYSSLNGSILNARSFDDVMRIKILKDDIFSRIESRFSEYKTCPICLS